MSRSMVGRADLARALATNDTELVSQIGNLLGFERTITERALPVKTSVRLPVETAHSEPPPPSMWPADMPDTWFWRPVRFEVRQRITIDPDTTEKPARLHWSNPPQVAPAFLPLARWNVIGARLRKSLADWRKSREIDVPKLVGRLARGEFLYGVPHRSLRRWGSHLHVILDLSDRLVPFFKDQDLVLEQMRRLLPDTSIAVSTGADPDDLVQFTPGGAASDLRVEPESVVLVLGDLGVLDTRNPLITRRWLRWGRRLRDSDCNLLALVPCAETNFSLQFRRVFSLVPWQRNARAHADRRVRRRMVQRLITLVSPALRVEPDLLRAVRRLMPEAVDASLEADAWQHDAVTSRHQAGASLDREYVADHLLAEFENESAGLRAAVLEQIRRRRGYAPEIWFEELLGLSDGSRELVPSSDLQDAYACTRFLSEAVARPHHDTHQAAADYSRRATDRLPEGAWQDVEIGPTLRELWQATHAAAEGTPPGFDPAELEPGASVTTHRLCQSGPELRVDSAIARSGPSSNFDASPLATVQSTNGWFALHTPDPFWKSGKAPAWAHRWGEDRYGCWCEIAVPRGDQGEVVQRLRWIPAGTFVMGSPTSEPERQEREGPQHEVTISQGFWMFDSAVTQELWQAVMENNPSRFQGDRLPVEQVSWHDCQEFLGKLSALVPESTFDLPSEAQWEYACRAGKKTPFSFGDNITPEQVNYDGNYPYVGGSKGLYRQTTVDVASLPANAWGLYEMHGNVDEWCHDGQRKYAAEPVVDPVGPTDEGADRVIRGGGWDSGARVARSAFRYADEPGYRDYYLGFRCARVQEAGQVAEPEASSKGSEAEPRTGEKHRGEASRIVVHLGENSTCDLPSLPRLRVLTDLEEIELERFTKPSWASAIGRDECGLWAEFLVEADDAEPVTQKMRWIPPGRFLMGSDDPEDSPYRDAKPQHEVTITHGFWLFDTPVTQALWNVVSDDNPSEFKGNSRPVESVSWHDCQVFMKRLAARIAGLDLVLPTEAEWEYACRAGTQTAWSVGDQITPKDACYWSKSAEEGTVDVAAYTANPWGLFDIHGNVWEWCHDGPRDYGKDAVVDPMGSVDEGAVRVIRGGSWDDDARYARSAFRYAVGPGDRHYYLGFRCARVQEPARTPSEKSVGHGVAEQPGRSD